MKKITALLLSIIMVFSIGVPVSAVSFTTTDALNILKAAAGMLTLTDEQQEQYDVNGDGKIDTADAVAVLRIAVGASETSSSLSTTGSLTQNLNAAGNLANGGIAAMDGDGWFYYAGTTGKINKMRPDGSNKTTFDFGFSVLTGIPNINVAGDWVYFSGQRDGGFYIAKVDKNGNNFNILTEVEFNSNNLMTVDGDWIYYTDNGTLRKMKTDGTSKDVITGDSHSQVFVRCFSVVGDWIYYNTGNTGNKDICKIKTDGTEQELLTSTTGNTTVIIVEGDRIYYNNWTQEIRWVGIDGTGGASIVTETNEYGNGSIWGFNVSGDTVYYYSNAGGGTMNSIKTDGTGKKTFQDTFRAPYTTPHYNIIGDRLYFWASTGDGYTLASVTTDGRDFKRM